MVTSLKSKFCKNAVIDSGCQWDGISSDILLCSSDKKYPLLQQDILIVCVHNSGSVQTCFVLCAVLLF